jgi:hypothetical protein
VKPPAFPKLNLSAEYLELLIRGRVPPGGFVKWPEGAEIESAKFWQFGPWSPYLEIRFRKKEVAEEVAARPAHPAVVPGA